VVFVSPEADGRRKFYKTLNKLAEVKRFDALEKDELEKWVMSEFLKLGRKVSLAVARRLCAIAGNDTGQIFQEINKLDLYAEGRDVTEKDLEEVVHPNPQESIFALTDALASRDADKMLKYFRALVDAGEAIPQIFYMLVRQVRLLVMAKSVLEEGKGESMASELKLHPFVVRGLKKQAEAFSWDKLKEMYDKLLHLDTQMKTSEIEQSVDDTRELEAAIEEFLLSLSE
jgi:DNA polymerase-3 subunit delta